jgi:hypothetical protein
MSRDRRGNGIQEVDGSIPFGSTNVFNGLEQLTSRRPDALSAVLARFGGHWRALLAGRFTLPRATHSASEQDLPA